MPRASFLNMLIDEAAAKGNTIYEELQGDSIIKSAEANWNEVAAIATDTFKGSVEDAEHLFKVIHPAIDASPGRMTLEDKIDPILFDPDPNVGPLQLMGMGLASSSAAAAAGAKHVARQVGFKVGGLFNAHRTVKAAQAVDEVAPRAAGLVDDGVTKVVEGMSHAQGGASTESMQRAARGVRYYKFKGGRAELLPQGGEDVAAQAGELVAQVDGKSSFFKEVGRRVTKADEDLLATLKPGKARDVGKANTVALDLAEDAAKNKDFLDDLGVGVGQGPRPPRRFKK